MGRCTCSYWYNGPSTMSGGPPSARPSIGEMRIFSDKTDAISDGNSGCFGQWPDIIGGTTEQRGIRAADRGRRNLTAGCRGHCWYPGTYQGCVPCAPARPYRASPPPWSPRPDGRGWVSRSVRLGRRPARPAGRTPRAGSARSWMPRSAAGAHPDAGLPGSGEGQVEGRGLAAVRHPVFRWVALACSMKVWVSWPAQTPQVGPGPRPPLRSRAPRPTVWAHAVRAARGTREAKVLVGTDRGPWFLQ